MTVDLKNLVKKRIQILNKKDTHQNKDKSD